MEGFATSTGLLPEQVWDEADRPELHLALGRPTESATPLVWAHAEYVKLVRSAADGEVFDRVPEVVERYGVGRHERPWREVWKFNRQPRTVAADAQLRVIADQPFRLRRSRDAWATSGDVDSRESGLGLHYVDLEALDAEGARWTFTFYWPLADRWEDRDFAIDAVAPHAHGDGARGPGPPPPETIRLTKKALNPSHPTSSVRGVGRPE
jgi:glucoamylase